MTKSEIEYHIMMDKLKELPEVQDVKQARNEIEVSIESKNPHWGMPNNLENLLNNEDITGDKWAIVDFSHVDSELEETNKYRITLYIRSF